MLRRVVCLLGLLFLCGPVVAQRGLIDLPMELEVPIAPTPVKADGKTHLVYELHLTNFAGAEINLSRIEVLDSAGKVLASYEGADLNSRLARPGLPQSNQEKQRIGGGMRATHTLPNRQLFDLEGLRGRGRAGHGRERHLRRGGGHHRGR